jgi:catechol 2,3-dioxygenase-like lactoylglutathione lyase family enzyme
MPIRRIVVDHVTVGVSDLPRSCGSYGLALAPLGFRERPERNEDLPEVEFGVDGSYDFAISTAYGTGTRVQVAFAADSRAQVDAFHEAALAAGGRDHGAPGLRPEYSDRYYGAFVLDPDGHNIEAVYHE